MHDSKIRETLSALLPDVVVQIGNLKGFFKGIGGSVAFHHDVGGNHIHGRQRSDSASVASVTPASVVFSRRVNPNGEANHQRTGKHQQIRRNQPKLLPVQGEDCRFMDVENRSDGHKQQRKQQPDAFLPFSGCDIRIQKRQKCQGDPDQPDNQLYRDIAHRPHRAGYRHHPYRHGRLIERFFTADESKNKIEYRCRNGKNDLVPEADIPRSAKTKYEKPHCNGRQHAHKHHPCQRIIPADIQMNFLFHSLLLSAHVTGSFLLRR